MVRSRRNQLKIQPGHPDFDIDEDVRRRYPNQCQHQVDGLVCGRKHYCKGLCYAHYKRMKRYGTCGRVYIAPPAARHLKGWMVLQARQKINDGVWTISHAARTFKCSRESMREAVRGITFKALTAPSD